MHYYANAMRNYANFSGRASRSDYWYYVLIYVVICFLAGFGDGFIHGFFRTHENPNILSAIVHLVHFVPSLSIFVRRLHDTDRSGWWYFAAFTIVGLIPLFIFSVTRGTAGPNRFGPDPVNTEAPLSGGPTVRFG
ncbi:Uncharacterized membrane protein YhaH, DUF805 family [Methylobacterium sp. UNC378MF]|jgi:uncharacterized membrane protein YhaH (DUF805 family)|uniref:DUF805 domain-containing protein n=1 Tax=Methylobacterium sp. UNC378MF TaxID=1502748 RepID=UPI00089150C6|nr:DUF805 domain-containing protein [Methylobacterium sp. UNC378MF]SDA18095.1 Uncharacterized membrane protein YhaH, DUF805 family [Methylobacterium sp. UNC378MF]